MHKKVDRMQMFAIQQKMFLGEKEEQSIRRTSKTFKKRKRLKKIKEKKMMKK